MVRAPESMTHPAEPLSFLRHHARTILGVALAALLVHDISGTHGFLAMRRTQKEIERLRREIRQVTAENRDRKSTRLNSSHLVISYAVFCLKKKKNNTD